MTFCHIFVTYLQIIIPYKLQYKCNKLISSILFLWCDFMGYCSFYYPLVKKKCAINVYLYIFMVANPSLQTAKNVLNLLHQSTLMHLLWIIHTSINSKDLVPRITRLGYSFINNHLNMEHNCK